MWERYKHVYIQIRTKMFSLKLTLLHMMGIHVYLACRDNSICYLYAKTKTMCDAWCSQLLNVSRQVVLLCLSVLLLCCLAFLSISMIELLPSLANLWRRTFALQIPSQQGSWHIHWLCMLSLHWDLPGQSWQYHLGYMWSCWNSTSAQDDWWVLEWLLMEGFQWERVVLPV